MRRNIHKWVLLIILCSFMGSFSQAYAAGAQSDTDKLHNTLISYTSDALLAARDEDWAKSTIALAGFKATWTSGFDIAEEAKQEAAEVDTALVAAEQAITKAEGDAATAYQAVSALAKATDKFVSLDDHVGASVDVHQLAQSLIPALQKSVTAIAAEDWTVAKSSYSIFIRDWGKAESAIRKQDAKLYGQIEVKISAARIALNTEPANVEQASAKLRDLITTLEEYAAGMLATDNATSGIQSINGLVSLLGEVKGDIRNELAADASVKMDEFISSWPNAEGEVRTRSSQDYANIENRMISLSSMLLSNPPDMVKADEAADALILLLEPYAHASDYTAWDAGAILFREGLEAILIVTSLLTMLNRSGNSVYRKWVWSGATIGIVFSVILAVVLTVFLSHISTGSSRELFEGVAALVSVLFMVTIGAWLHGKSNLNNWNLYVERTVGLSIAKGTLWSLAFAAFLAVMREGAESIIFYAGMAASISFSDLLIGIGGAAVLLAIIAFAIVKLSARIPIRLFFLLAGVLLYYMAYKFMGAGIHALQVSGRISAHVSDALPEIPSIGMYGNWEVFLPQMAVLIVIVSVIITLEWKKRSASERLGQPANNIK
ncbi:MAG: FTR1 family iron permease [Candidatus Cohnella colombiensis]|uniref:FTR1 family iron permease n=1 Tax=Candidatus Cohnella colombiensis TaxID=3121368 RepID=A0AA95F5Y0_9BACL|nr:MAG: FTR1 family iron permease [Cohnella sp.]